MSHTDVLFRDLHADDLPEVTEQESLCMSCFDNGITRYIFTKIPFFHEVVVASFTCDHCGYQNTSIDSAGKIQNKGIKIELTLKKASDLNRRLVQSKYAVLKIPHLESEFPTSEGKFTTIEGCIESIITNLELLQEDRKKADETIGNQVDEFIKKLRNLLTLENVFVIELSDPSGNSIIENKFAPKSDPQLKIDHFTRTAEQNEILCINDEQTDENTKTYVDETEEEFKGGFGVESFAVDCPKCNVPTETRMKMLDIPHFKEVIVMATTCDQCGYKENEIKGGCGIADKGQKFTLKIKDVFDLKRDLLKSEHATLCIPELDIETSTGGALGGRFTTVEGVLRLVAEQLQQTYPFFCGDSADPNFNETDKRLKNLVDSLNNAAEGNNVNGELTFIMRDITGNSFIQDIYEPEVDPCLTVEYFERNNEENDDLGLNDMKTEDY